MSELEDPLITIQRLINKNIRVVKEDGSIANLLVTPEWYDREFAKEYDGQITVGLEQSTDQKLELSGRLRRRLISFRCNVWTVDKTASSDPGRLMRDKITAQLNAIIRENRNLPNRTTYNFSGLGYPHPTTHKAESAGSSTELAPNHSLWAELADSDYQKIWYSDDLRYSKSHNVAGEYAMMLFRFKIESRENTIEQMALSFEGYGTAPAGNGFLIEVWNHAVEAWQNAQASPATAEDSAVTISLTSNIGNYVDPDGYVWLFGRTYHPSDGATPSVLYCDFVQCAVDVNGLTYCDVASFRNSEVTDVKPYVYRAEFILKGWFFESLSGAF